MEAGLKVLWTLLGSNQRPYACEASAGVTYGSATTISRRNSLSVIFFFRLFIVPFDTEVHNDTRRKEESLTRGIRRREKFWR